MPAPPAHCLLSPQPSLCSTWYWIPAQLSSTPQDLPLTPFPWPSLSFQTTSELITSGSSNLAALTRPPRSFLTLPTSVRCPLQAPALLLDPVSSPGVPWISHPTLPLAPSPLCSPDPSLALVLFVSLGSRALRVTLQPSTLRIPSPPTAQTPLAPRRGLPAALPPARSPRRRSVPTPPVAAAPASAAQAAATSLPPPTPGAHSRPASRACVCELVLRHRPVRGGGGRLRAGGS